MQEREGKDEKEKWESEKEALRVKTDQKTDVEADKVLAILSL